MTKNYSPSFGAVVGSEIRDKGWIKIRIRDKHHGSATLPITDNQLMAGRSFIPYLIKIIIHMKKSLFQAYLDCYELAQAEGEEEIANIYKTRGKAVAKLTRGENTAWAQIP
jgi:hypothetical protein